MSSILNLESTAKPGDLIVHTTDNRGHTPEEWAKIAIDRIIDISDESPEPIRLQAHAFKDTVEQLLVLYFKQAIDSHICTVNNLLEKQGHADVAAIIRRL
jgi:hypothetical protein